MTRFIVKIDLLDDECMPERMTQQAAAFDLKSRVDMVVEPSRREIIPCGFRLGLPPGTEGQIRGRSGMTLKGHWTLLGTIDSDYRGEVMVIMHNDTILPLTIQKGQRIAQLAIREVPEIAFDLDKDLPDSSRNTGGFGSTGAE